MERAPVRVGFGWICAPMIEIRSKCEIGCRGVVEIRGGMVERGAPGWGVGKSWEAASAKRDQA